MCSSKIGQLPGVGFGVGMALVIAAWFGPALPAYPQADTHGTGSGCDSYDQRVDEELALLARITEPPMAAAVSSARDMPGLTVGTARTLSLAPQSELAFAAEPGRVTLDEGGYGGMVAFEIATAGAYRISLTNGSWVDVVADASAIESEAFAGRADCRPLRKLVDYALPAGRYILQLSGATDAEVGILVTENDGRE